MRKGLAAFGVILIVIGLVMIALFYPLVGYSKVDDTCKKLEDKLGGISIDSLSGVKVKCKGTVSKSGNEITEEYGLSDILDVTGKDVITLKGLEVTTTSTNVWGESSTQTLPVIVISDETGLKSSDKVTVEGYAFGASGFVIVLGESGVSSISSMSMGDIPAANVEKVPTTGFYLGIGVFIFGIILAAVSARDKKSRAADEEGGYHRTEQPVEDEYEEDEEVGPHSQIHGGKEEPPDRHMAVEKEGNECPDCGHPYLEGATHCSNCGLKLFIDEKTEEKSKVEELQDERETMKERIENIEEKIKKHIGVVEKLEERLNEGEITQRLYEELEEKRNKKIEELKDEKKELKIELEDIENEMEWAKEMSEKYF